MSYCPHCTHCEAMTEHKEKAARRKRELEEEEEKLIERLNNEAKRRRLDFVRERKKMEEKLEEDIESYETRQLGRFKEKKEKEEKELAEEERSIREDGLKYGDNYAAYTLDDIRRINNYSFLCRMEEHLWPDGQPDEDETERLNERHRAILKRQNDVLFLAMD